MANRPGTAIAEADRGLPADAERRQRGIERSRALARSRRSRAGRLTLTIATMVGVIWVGWFSPLFGLDATKIAVVGAGESVDEASVRGVLASYAGTPLSRLDPGAMAAAVEALDGVRSASVARKWPNGIRVSVIPRVPIAALPGEAGAFVLVDADGVPVGQPVADPGTLPVVDVAVGSDHARALDAVVAVLASLPTELAQRVQSAGAQTEDTVQFTLGDGTKIVWGGASDAALKAQVVLTMVNSPATHAAVIDVSAPTLPVTHG